jgi:hypothetical protein
MLTTLDPTLFRREAERATAKAKNAPQGAVSFFVHKRAFYATVVVLEMGKCR